MFASYYVNLHNPVLSGTYDYYKYEEKILPIYNPSLYDRW